VVLVFFSFSSRIEHYAMPIFPPFALLIGIILSPENLLHSPADSRRQRSVARGFAILGTFGGIIALLLAGLLIWFNALFSGESLSHAATARLHAYRYYFAPLFEMPPDILDRLKIPFAGTCVLLAAGLLGAWWMNRRHFRKTAVMILCFMTVGFCFFAFQSLGICEAIISSKQFGQRLNQLYRPGDCAVVLGDFETANSVNFYCPAILHVYGGTAAVLGWGLTYHDAPEVVFSRSRLDEKWNGPDRTFLLGPEDQIPALGLRSAHTIMQSGGRIMLCNQPVP
jgi:hypothetical protein